MKLRPISAGCLFASLVFALVASGAELRVATFRSDVTPAQGEPLIWVTPTTKVEDPLWAKGIVLENGRERYLLCAVDWCGLGSSIHRLFRTKIAAAAGTDISRVAVHSVHQHTAPYIDGDAYALLRKLPQPPLLMSDAFLESVTDRLARAVKEATTRLAPFDRIGTGQAKVVRVASARRVFAGGKLITRYSTGGRDPAIAALPEGAIDAEIRTVTLAAGDKPLVRLHYYATHPQTFCCDGRVSGDFVSAAREAVERKEKVFQVYFTGCSGDVTVGKYNDGSDEAREGLARRLEDGMAASIASTRTTPATALRWRTASLSLPKAAPAALDASGRSGQDLYRAALTIAFAQQKTPLEAALLQIGGVRILHLPGEPMLEFQKYAQHLSPNRFIAVAAYGDISPGYLCTDQAFSEGGYEPSASNTGPGAEARIKQAIQKLLSP